MSATAMRAVVDKNSSRKRRLAAHPSTSSAVSSISEEDLNGAVHRPMVSNQCEPPAPQRVKVAPTELVEREQLEIHSSESDDQSGTVDSGHFALTTPWDTLFCFSHHCEHAGRACAGGTPKEFVHDPELHIWFGS